MKRVSFKVVKALIEAGYNLKELDYTLCALDETETECAIGNITYEKPYYVQIWLWLWREKNIKINILKEHPSGATSVYTDTYSHAFNAEDPEEAIAKAIEYLVDNKLLK